MKIKVVVCRLGKPPEIEEIDNGLESLQGTVGGYVECLPLDHRIDIWCDEEGKVKGLPANRLVGRKTPIHGDFLIAKCDEEGNTVGLTNAEAQRWVRRAAEWPVGRTWN
jgi:hypothetical protein